MLGPSEGGLGGQDALDGFPASGRNADPSRANPFFADEGYQEGAGECQVKDTRPAYRGHGKAGENTLRVQERNTQIGRPLKVRTRCGKFILVETCKRAHHRVMQVEVAKCQCIVGRVRGKVK